MTTPPREAREARKVWLADRRAAVEATYDAGAATYDALEAAITPTHREFVGKLLATCPPNGTILDVPCGTGRYFGMVKEAGRRVVGVDQSAGMLAQARAKGVADRLEKIGLQELAFAGEFDGVMTIDALENVSPEDWPRVLANLHRALRAGGQLYFTVEEVDEAEIEAAFAAARKRGLPAIHGEIVEGDVAGYHYYPGREQVDRWLADERLEVVETGYNQGDGYGYYHRLVRSIA